MLKENWKKLDIKKEMKRMKKLKPLTLEEHKALALDMRKAQEIMEPWLQRLWEAYGVKSKDASQLFQVLNLLSSKMCCQLDNRYYQTPITEKEHAEFLGHKSPYYGNGKVAYI